MANLRPLADQLAFYREMSGPDAFNVVIKAGAFIDHELITLIDETVVYPTALKQVHLDYSERCALIVALGLDPRFLPPLKVLGKIRNKLAHNPGAALTVGDANNLYEALSPADREIVLTSYPRTVEARGEKASRFADLAPLDRFVLVAIALRSALVAARRQILASRTEA